MADLKTTMQALPDDAREIILNTISCGVFTVDAQWRITSFNNAVSQLTGIPEREALGRPCREVLRGDICSGNCALRETLASGNPIVNRPFALIDSKGRRRPVAISTAVFRGKDGSILGGLESIRDLTVIEELRKEIARSYRLNDIVSRNHQMGRIFELLPRIAQTSSTVLITGESGTGKELTARAVHALSERRDSPFVALNCAALPDSLLESELFGYKKGAFTDAKTDKKGRVDLARGGSLFLDEIGDISPAFQAKLLRFLQDRTYEALGSQRQEKADVRIIVATNKNLKQLVYAGVFREDLYYRVNVVNIELPPLRQRLEDIPLLVDHFIQHFNALQGKSIRECSTETLGLLMGYSYPGNIRELENFIEYAFVLCNGDTILPSHLPTAISGDVRGETEPGGIDSPGQSLVLLETSFIAKLLAEHGNNCAETAKCLGLHPTTLYRRLKKLGIPTPFRNRQ